MKKMMLCAALCVVANVWGMKSEDFNSHIRTTIDELSKRKWTDNNKHNTIENKINSFGDCKFEQIEPGDYENGYFFVLKLDSSGERLENTDWCKTLQLLILINQPDSPTVGVAFDSWENLKNKKFQAHDDAICTIIAFDDEKVLTVGMELENTAQGNGGCEYRTIQLNFDYIFFRAVFSDQLDMPQGVRAFRARACWQNSLKDKE